MYVSAWKSMKNMLSHSRLTPKTKCFKLILTRSLVFWSNWKNVDSCFVSMKMKLHLFWYSYNKHELSHKRDSTFFTSVCSNVCVIACVRSKFSVVHFIWWCGDTFIIYENINDKIYFLDCCQNVMLSSFLKEVK